MEPMPKQSKNSPAPIKIYLQPKLARSAKTHSARNGFTLSGWVSLLLKKALTRKSASPKKPRWSLSKSLGRRELPSTAPIWSWL